MLKYIFKTLSRNQLRSLLTALGVIIGVWAVILLVAIGNGLKSYINKQFESLGANVVYIMPIDEAQFTGQGGGFSPGSTISFDRKDAREIARAKNAKLSVPTTSSSGIATYQAEEQFTQIVGTTTDIVEGMNLEIEFGRFFNTAEERRGRNIAVLGWKVKDELFGEINPVGKNIKVNNKILQIIGTVERKGGSLSTEVDNHIYIPYQTVWRMIEKKEFHSFLLVANNKDSIQPLKKELEEIMLERYDEEDFSVVDQADLLGTVQRILSIITGALAGIAAISLIVGGVGIMNTMYVTIAERTREIGLRKAIGATNKDIRNQFLIESAILSVGGGAIGLILSFVTTLILNYFFPAQITLWSIFLALSVSCAVGIIFGLAPARKASKLSPVEALRYE